MGESKSVLKPMLKSMSPAVPVMVTAKFPFAPELAGLLLVAMLGAVGYLLFPDDLAFLTRLISIALLVLSLDLVTGYCGVATLGHAALFGVSAYAAGNACLAGGTYPVRLL